MFNQALLIGRITKDIEVRRSQQGNAVVNFSIAINKKYQDKESVTYVGCVAFSKTAELISQYCGKGSLVMIEGEINTRSYEDKNNEKRYITEVIVRNIQFLDHKQKEMPKVEVESTPKSMTTWDRPKVEDDPDLPF